MGRALAELGGSSQWHEAVLYGGSIGTVILAIQADSS
jgi:hypothetical protein